MGGYNGRILSGGFFQGDFVRGDFVLGGILSGGFVREDFVLEPGCSVHRGFIPSTVGEYREYTGGVQDTGGYGEDTGGLP